MRGRVVVVGHGLIERQVRGPSRAGGRPEQIIVHMRRYRCRACRVVIIVGPRGLVRRRWYSAGAMALAIALYARGQTSRAVRAATSPAHTIGSSAEERWATLLRWIEATRGGGIFAVQVPSGLTRRGVAERVMLALAARAGRDFGADLVESAFAGASIAA